MNWEATYRFALNKPDNEPFTAQDLAIIQEWESGQWQDNMKADLDDPNVMEQLAMYCKYKLLTGSIYDQKRI